MNKMRCDVARLSAGCRRSPSGLEQPTFTESENLERWSEDVHEARKLIAAKITHSVKFRWGTAVALQTATGICQTEISRIRRGKFERFSLERLVHLLWIIDPDVEVHLQVKVVRRPDE
ncbi:MAG: XRE family transcriptional regulator [Proteobacteria bacterium]|nr:XRE family transcriptional regulator [Pseudomonadota bacterium]